MGGGQSREQQLKKQISYNPDHWKPVKTGGYSQYVFDNQGREADVNILKLSPERNIKDELQIYLFRKNASGPIVKCYGLQPLTQNSQICGAGHQIKVITERIVKRWYQLPQLTFEEILYALSQALQGYKLLAKEVGSFQINQNMIGVNKIGEVLVWINQNFGQNKPSFQKGVLYSTENFDALHGNINQSEIVKSIFNIIQQKCQQGKYPPDFKQFSRQIINCNPTFDSALLSVKNYIMGKNIQIVNKIHPDPQKMYTSRKTSAIKQQKLFGSANKSPLKQYKISAQPTQSVLYTPKNQPVVPPRSTIIQPLLQPLLFQQSVQPPIQPPIQSPIKPPIQSSIQPPIQSVMHHTIVQPAILRPASFAVQSPPPPPPVVSNFGVQKIYKPSIISATPVVFNPVGLTGVPNKSQLSNVPVVFSSTNNAVPITFTHDSIARTNFITSDQKVQKLTSKEGGFQQSQVVKQF